MSQEEIKPVEFTEAELDELEPAIISVQDEVEEE